jgi:hypothetical protein
MASKLPILTSVRMRALIAVLIVLWIALSVAAAARTRAGRSHPARDDEYIFALAAANRFLQAWQTHDQETGVLLLTNAAKQHCSEDRLNSLFSSNSQAAYEIGRGRKLRGTRYLFPVTIFAHAHARSGSVRVHHSDLIITKMGRADWAVDKLP